MKYLALLFCLLPVTAFAQQKRTIPNRALNQDLCLNVNVAGTPTDELCVNGTSGDVSITNNLTVNSTESVVSIVSNGSGGDTVSLGSFNTCPSPSVGSHSIQWWKFSYGQMHVLGDAHLSDGTNGGCETSIDIILPQSFSSLMTVSCAAGIRNGSVTGPSSGMDCKVVHEKNTLPYGNHLVLMLTTPTTYAGGNLQVMDIEYSIWGAY